MFGRVLEKGMVKGKSRNLMFSSDDMLTMGEKPMKGDKLPKQNIHFSDGTDKYMSYIKVRHSPFLISERC